MPEAAQAVPLAGPSLWRLAPARPVAWAARLPCSLPADPRQRPRCRRASLTPKATARCSRR
eukprot:5422790-Alexandrium_andersonii.AAC.1